MSARQSRPEAGFSQFHNFIQDYKRVKLDSQICYATVISSQDLTVWVNVAEEWTRLPESEVASLFDARLEGSVCGLLFSNVFGLTAPHYQAFKRSLMGHTRSGADGLYVHKTEPHKYALVVRLPVAYTSWPFVFSTAGQLSRALLPLWWVFKKKRGR